LTRALLLALGLTAPPTASAQDAPSGWRVAPSAGIVTTFQPTLGLRVERASAPVHIGVRGWAITDGLGTDDGATMAGGGLDTRVSIGARGRWAELWAATGLGVATLDHSPGGFGCSPEFEVCSPAPSSAFRGLRPYVPLAVGVDVYPTPAVGIGGAIEGAVMAGPANVSELSVGLRVRAAR